MQCPNCGNEVRDERFCGACGSPLPEPAPAPQAPAVVAQPAQPTGAAATQPPARKKRGCGCGCAVLGCLGVFLIVALVALATVGWYLRWPEQWGLVESPATEFFDTSPNPWAADFLVEEFEGRGLPVEGVTFYVMPKDGGETHTVYVLVEEGQGFTWSHDTYPNPIEGILVLTATSDTAEAFKVDRVAVDYRDTDDVQVAVMTAPTQALIEFADGTIGQDELFDQMNGRTPDSSPFTIDLGGGE